MKYWSEENGKSNKQTAQNQMDETYCQDLHCLPGHKCIGLNRLNGSVHEISVLLFCFVFTSQSTAMVMLRQSVNPQELVTNP